MSSGKMKLGTAVAVIAAGAVGALYYLWKKEEAQSQTKDNQSVDNNSSLMEKSDPKPQATQAQVPAPTEQQDAQKTVTQTLSESINSTLAGKGPGYNEILQKVKFRVEQEKSQPNLSMQLIILIHDALVEFSYKNFGHLCISNRIERRQFMKTDLLKYETIVRNGTED